MGLKKILVGSKDFGSLIRAWAIASIILVGASACGHKEVKPDEDSAVPSENPAVLAEDLSSDGDHAYGLQTIHFDYDSSLISAEAKAILKANAEVLKKNPTLRIQIEGHCDQRGGIQYNIALGEKRAKAAEHFLEDLGIPNARISTVSLGKEKPIDPAESESAYAKNRRANFVITKSIG